MAKNKDNRSWKAVMPAAGLVLLVLLILAVTAVQRTDRPPDLTRPGPLSGAAAPDHPLQEAEEPRTAPERPAPDRPGSLEDRAARDYRRLSGMEDRYTSHLMLSCDPENTRRHLEAAGWDERLYLLPSEHQGRDCFRLCWRLYPTREAAEAEGEILPYLAGQFPDRTPKALAEIRP